MKLEFTRAEVERIILNHANRLVGHVEMVPFAKPLLFNTVEGSSYCGLPDTITVSGEEKDNAAQ